MPSNQAAIAKDTARPAKCRFCGDAILWVQIFDTRGWTALDVAPSPRGQAILFRDNVGAVLVDPEVTYTANVHERRHYLHKTTCNGWPSLRSSGAALDEMLTDFEEMSSKDYWDERRERIRWAKLQAEKRRDYGS